MTTRRATLKGDLLAHYATKEPTAFYQYDVFTHCEGDSEMGPDEDGDSCMSCATYELMSGGPAVRVLVTAGTPGGDVVRALKKVRRWVKRDGFAIQGEDLARRDARLAAEVCPRCGQDMDGRHHRVCRYADGTPTELSDEEVQRAVKVLDDPRCAADPDAMPF